MTVPIAIALALPGEAVEQHVLSVFERARGFDVRRRCLEIEELLGLAQSGQLDVAIIAGRVLRWDSEVIARLHTCGVCVVAIVAKDGDIEQFAQWGSDLIVTDEPRLFERDELVGEVSRTLASFRLTRAQHPHGFAHQGVVPRASVKVASEKGKCVTPPTDGPTAQLIAVWGPTGAPGRSTTAAGVAGALAQRSQHVLLIDADPYGGALAPMLGLQEPDIPGLASACRLAHHGQLTTPALMRLVHEVEPGLSLLTGLLRADRWPELRSSALDQIWTLVRNHWDVVVVDVGFCLEEDEELSYDSMVPRRNAATISALMAADQIVAVGSADVVGLARLVRGIDQLVQVVDRSPTVVVANRGVGRSRQLAVLRHVQEILEASRYSLPVVVFPLDDDACRKALQAGRSVANIAPQTSLGKAIVQLASNLTAGTAREQGGDLDERGALGRLRRLSA